MLSVILNVTRVLCRNGDNQHQALAQELVFSEREVHVRYLLSPVRLSVVCRLPACRL